MESLLFIAVLPVFVICYFIYKKDSNKEPAGLLFKLLFFGMLSCFPAIILEIFLGSFFPIEEEMNTVIFFFYNFIVIAFVEELCKFVFTYFGAYNHWEFTNLYDMMVFATFVSLGFALFENILYVFSGGFYVGIIRAIFAVPGHACDGLVMGYYLGLCKIAQYNNNSKLVKKNMFLSLFVPIIMHTFYDFCLSTNNVYLLIFWLMYVVWIYIFLFRKIKYISMNVKDFVLEADYCRQCGYKNGGQFCPMCGRKYNN